MSSLNDILTVARSGILSQQERLNVIGHNITNVHTEGYHRQRVALGTNPANMPNISVTIPYAQGAGVRVQDVYREYDLLRERALLGELADFAHHEHLAKLLPDLETLMLSGTQGGFDEALHAFWHAWQDVASQPDALAMRHVLLERAGKMTDLLNQMAGALDDYAGRVVQGTPPALEGALPKDVEQVNEWTAELQRLNRRIRMYEATGVSTADLQDRRDLLVRELSKMLEVNVDASYNVRIDGELLVSADGQAREELQLVAGDPPAFEVGGEAVTIERGVLGAWGAVLDYVDSLNDSLDAMAGQLIDSVNALHTQGYDLDGQPGIDFFTGTDAGSVAVNRDLYDPDNPLLSHPRRVAAAGTLHDPGGPDQGPNTGDGSIALEMAALARATHAALDGQTLNRFWTQVNAALGESARAERAASEQAHMVIRMLNNAIQSETGVNLDEELVDMITAQRAYQAAARLAADANSMFDVIMNM